VLREPPGREAGEYEWSIFEQAGVLTSSQAIRLIGRRQVDGHVGQGRWRRIGRGLLLTHNGRLELDQQLWVAVLSAGDDAHLAGMTAMAAGGATGLRMEHLQVLIPGSRSRSTRPPGFPPDMTRVRIYRTALLPTEHRHIGRPPRTSMPRSVIDAAAWASTGDQARLVIMKACQQRLVNAHELDEALSHFPRLRRHALIARTINDISGGITALSEASLVALCRRYGLPEPEMQHLRKAADGRNRYLDAYWPAHRLHVEVDGAHHMSVDHWSADMLRQNQIWIEGDRILRFPAWLLRTNPEAVANQLVAALTTHQPIL
jgi:hypothetical protein